MTRCPVCAARFRGACECSRCGADLQTLMTVVARAWGLRRQARAALRAGDAPAARQLAAAAQRLTSTERGRRLEAVAAILAEAVAVLPQLAAAAQRLTSTERGRRLEAVAVLPNPAVQSAEPPAPPEDARDPRLGDDWPTDAPFAEN